jgi:hypothetical protein
VKQPAKLAVLDHRPNAVARSLNSYEIVTPFLTTFPAGSSQIRPNSHGCVITVLHSQHRPQLPKTRDSGWVGLSAEWHNTSAAQRQSSSASFHANGDLMVRRRVEERKAP